MALLAHVAPHGQSAAFVMPQPTAPPAAPHVAPLVGVWPPDSSEGRDLTSPTLAFGATPTPQWTELGVLAGAAAAGVALRAAARRPREGPALPRRAQRPRLAPLAGVGRQASAGAAASAPSTAGAPGEAQGQDNGVEEFLLGVDLPQPLRPVLGSGAWASFAAALAQMGVIAALAGLGTFLEQGGPPEFYAGRYPEFSGIILSLGLDQVYSSPLFLGLNVWLGFSLLACTGTTQLPLAKRAQRIATLSAGALRRRGSFLIRMRCGQPPAEPSAAPAAGADAAALPAAPAAPAATAPGAGGDGAAGAAATAQRLCALRSALEFRGFAVRADDDASPTRIVAQRGLVGKFAPMLVHLSLIFVLLGGAAGIIFGASSEVIIPDGGSADIGKVLDRGRRIKGPLYEALNPFRGLIRSAQVRVDDFKIKYRDSGPQKGEVEQYFSSLVVEDTETKDRLFADQIFVNKPLRWGGATIYQADWSLDRLQLYVKGIPIVVPLKALPDEGAGRSWAAFVPLEIIQADDVRVMKRLKNPRQGIVLVCENMRNVQVYDSSQQLAGILRSPDAKMDSKMEGMPVQFGEEITVDGSQLRLDRVVGATGLIVKSDPGVPLVYLGFALLMPATLLSVLPFGQVWAATGEGEDADQVLVSGRTNRNQPAFEEEMKAMAISFAAP